MKNIAVFASGEGSNLHALMSACGTGLIKGKISLVISSKKNAGAIKKAKKADIPFAVLSPDNFSDSGKYDKALSEICLKYEIDLICLAGFTLKLGGKILMFFKNRIMNVHPALLPAFAGKGMYGGRVHEAVIKSGVRLSGATVHFVNEKYDSGPIIIQKSVLVFPGDDSKSLGKRISEIEHLIYPEAVKLFCDDVLKINDGKVFISAKKRIVQSKHALISVSDKTGIVEFAGKLAKMNMKIISTSGTRGKLEKAGIPVISIESLTGFPEILGGRVKTLHPFIHGGILFKRTELKHKRDISEFRIEPIDIVIVNLYPFEKTAETEEAWSDELIENIDIGGVSLLRAAAKNYKDVAVVSNPDDYQKVADELEEKGYISLETKKYLALETFKRVSAYEQAIYSKLKEKPDDSKFPLNLNLKFKKTRDLRYGENPHQKCSFYSKSGELPFIQLQGKELSYNNILDAYGSWQAVNEFNESAAVIFKHMTPCGIGRGDNMNFALRRAWRGDPLSAFGGIIAANKEFDADMAEFISKKFLEVICAPDFNKEALEILSKKKNLRLIKWKEKIKDNIVFKSAGNELLLQEENEKLLLDKWEIHTAKKPSFIEEKALKFAWAAVKHIRSNAIVLTDENKTVGIGAGQMSRIDAAFIAARKYFEYSKNNPEPNVLVMASDAFFPFPDAVEEAAKTGVSAIIQPGGSIRDAEVVKAADKLRISMVFTGIRHFKH